VTAQIKQRIVGIVVLLFLALIILPWVFGSHQPAVFEDKNDQKNKIENAQATATISDNTIQESAHPTPDVQKAPTQSEPLNQVSEDELSDEEEPAKPISKPGSSNPKVVMNDDNNHSVKASTTSQVEPAKMSQIQNNMMHTQSQALPDEQPAPVAKAKPKTKVLALKKPNLSKARAVEHKANIKAAKEGSEKSLAIQLGSFSDGSNASSLVKKLKGAGYKAYSKSGKNSKGDAITRVFVGPEEQRTVAQEMVTKIDKLFNVHGVIVKSGA
jgi:DedD protein